MTTIYFIRHAEPNYDNHDEYLRELSDKGMKDRKLVSDYLKDKNITIALSSPFIRSINTIKDFTDTNNLKIETIDDFRERKICNEWIRNFNEYSKRQWSDFDYKLDEGESLREVQQRNIEALTDELQKYSNQNIVIGTHGTALSTIINCYCPLFNYDAFEQIRTIMPWIVEFRFDDNECKSIISYNVFTKKHTTIM